MIQVGGIGFRAFMVKVSESTAFSGTLVALPTSYSLPDDVYMQGIVLYLSHKSIEIWDYNTAVGSSASTNFVLSFTSR